MITKTPAKKGATTKVTFEVPSDVEADTICLCGDFNDWNREATPLTQRKGGRWTATLTLAQGRAYKFKYLIDGERWENDNGADEYIDNGYGSKDSVVSV